MRIMRLSVGLGLGAMVSFSGCGGSGDDGGSGGLGGETGGAGTGASQGTGASSSSGSAASSGGGVATGGSVGAGGRFGVGGRASGGDAGSAAGGAAGSDNVAGAAGSGPGPQCSCTIVPNPPASVDCDEVVWRCSGDEFEDSSFEDLDCTDAGTGFMGAQRYCCPPAADLCQ